MRPFELLEIKQDIYRDGLSGRPLSTSTVLGMSSTLKDDDEEEGETEKGSLTDLVRSWTTEPSSAPRYPRKPSVQRRLGDGDLMEIRAMAGQGICLAEIASVFSVSVSTVSRVSGRRRKS